MPGLHVGDVGAVIEVALTENAAVFDISSATVRNIVIKPPHRPRQLFAGTFTTDGTDGLLRLTTTLATDLPEAGVYEVQAQLSLPSGWTGGSEVGHIVVGSNL